MDAHLDVRLKSQPDRYRNVLRDYPQYYIIVVLTGTLFYEDVNAALRIERGRMAVLRPGSSFDLHTRAGGYSGVAIERTDPGIRELAGPSFVTDPSPRVSFLGDWIAEELALPGPQSAQSVEHLARLVLQIATSETEERPPGEPQLARSTYWAQRARQAIENSIYMVQGVHESLTDFPLSYRQLSRFINEHYGCTPKELQVQARLQEAKRLLRETEWSVTTIALELGFSSPQHFSTLFREWEGTAPTQWRSTQDRDHPE